MKGKKVFVFLGILVMFLYSIGCKDGTTSINPSPTDVVTITKITSEEKAQLLYVKMKHNLHEEAGVECVTCHHKRDNPARIKECAECHSNEKGDEILHTFCIECHMNSEEGPTKCDECHKYGKEVTLQDLR